MLARGLIRLGAASARQRPLLPAATPALHVRGINFWEVFSKERMAERRAELQEDINKGYFHEFSDLKENKGKVFPTWTALSKPAASILFPDIAGCVDGDGHPIPVPPTLGAGAPRATLITVAFRGSGQAMAESWSHPFGEHFAEERGVGLVEVSVVESGLLTLGVFRGPLLKALAKGAKNPHARPAFLVGQDTSETRRVLGMQNRLAGYAFLVDGAGRVRWQGCGDAGAEEVVLLVRAAGQLLKEQL